MSRRSCGHKGNIDTEARFENTYFFSVSVQRGNDALTGPPILPFHSVLYVPAWCACIQNLSLICMKTSIIGAHTFVFGEICGLVGGLKTRPFGVSSTAVDLDKDRYRSVIQELATSAHKDLAGKKGAGPRLPMLKAVNSTKKQTECMYKHISPGNARNMLLH